MKKHILLIEDEPTLVLGLTDLLSNEGYEIETTPDGLTGFQMACEDRHDLLLLDVNLPGKNGFDLCRDLRARGVMTPVLMLTARGQVTDKVVGLKLGADDYLTKPFDSLELLARVEARLRTPTAPLPAPPTSIAFGSISVNFVSTEIRRHGQLVDISPREFALLCFLIERPNVTLSRQEVLQQVWGYESHTGTRTVDVHLGWLRQKLEEDPKKPRHFLTVRSLGYKFVPCPE